MKTLKVAGFEKPFANPVAKHFNAANACATHADRKNDYKRKPKHRNKSED